VCVCVLLFDVFQDDLRCLFIPHQVNHGGVQKPPPQVSLYKSHTTEVGIPIDSGIDLSITIVRLRVFINKTLSSESLLNQLLIRGLDYQLSLIVDKLGQGLRSCKCTSHDLYAGGCQCITTLSRPRVPSSCVLGGKKSFFPSFFVFF